MVDNYLTKQEKRQILTEEFNVEITPELEKGVEEMCNLSEGIEQKGREKEKVDSAKRMIAKGKFTAEDISESVDLPLNRIKELMQEEKKQISPCL